MDALKKLKTYKIPATLIFYYLSSKHWGGCLELTTIKDINNENIASKVKEGLSECTDFGGESHECLIQKTRSMLAIGFIFYLYMCLEWAYPLIEECFFSEIGFSNFRFLVVMIQWSQKFRWYSFCIKQRYSRKNSSKWKTWSTVRALRKKRKKFIMRVTFALPL